MDFHSLSRKELQALCKQNKIPANITNVAMADSLAALQHVEGLEDFLNQSQSKPQQCPEDDTIVIGSPEAPRTSCRTSTRIRKSVNKEALESSQSMTRTRRPTKNQSVVEETEVDFERREVPPKTPAAPNTHRRGLPVSAAQKRETRKDEIGSVQRAYSTRRSVKLLELTLENLSIGEDVKIEPVKIDDFSKETDEKEVSLDDKEELKLDDSVEVPMKMNNTVQEEIKVNVHEEEGSELETELKDLVEVSDEKIDVKDETLAPEVLHCASITKLSDEVEIPIIKESLTDDSMAIEVSDEVKETVEVIIPSDLTSAYVPTEDLEVPSESGLEEPANEEESEDLDNLTSEVEESPKLETLTEKSLAEDSIVPSNNGSELNATEEETDADSSEVEETDEDSSEEEEESTESEGSDEESVDSVDGDVESENSDFESNLVDVNVVEARVSIPSNESRGKFDFVSEPVANEESADSDDKLELINVVIVQAEENKTPTNGSVSRSKFGPKTPFAADQLSGQFPRPSLPTPTKSSSKTHPIINMITDNLDENEEKKAEAKSEENDNDDKNCAPKLCNASLRQLHKMLKSKLQIENDKKEENTRVALQKLSENQIALNSLQNEN